jgi:hypothetical protein
MPISRTRTDYILSGVVCVLLAACGALAVYVTRPGAIVMRQPRMTVVIALAVIMGVSAFIFIGRSALPFFSRPLAWGAVIVSAAMLGLLALFNDAGTAGGWFRFFVFCTAFSLGATVLAEAMIFYRRFFDDAPWRFALWHKILFSIVVAGLTFAMGYAYYQYGVSGGAVIDYGVTTPITPPATELDPSQLPDGLSDLTDTAPLGTETTSAVNPDTPVSSETTAP